MPRGDPLDWEAEKCPRCHTETFIFKGKVCVRCAHIAEDEARLAKLVRSKHRLPTHELREVAELQRRLRGVPPPLV
jgi:hypothetical protein